MKLTNTTEREVSAFQVTFPPGEEIDVRDDMEPDRLEYLARKGVRPVGDAALEPKATKKKTRATKRTGAFTTTRSDDI